MPRCWRLNYANEFHMDITPSIPNPNCRFGGELVPDKTLKMWKASNPKGYKRLFEERAKLAPVIRLRKHVALDSARASVEPYPEAGGFKGILRRTVQIAKRHRDIMFVDESGPRAALGDHHHVGLAQLRMVRHQPRVRQRARTAVRRDPAHAGHHRDPPRRRPRAMVHLERDHRRRELRREMEPPAGARRGVLTPGTPASAPTLAQLEAVSGLDRLGDILKGLFGSRPATAAIDSLTERVSTARRAGNLRVAPAVGLSVGAIPASTSVRANTFYGSNR